MRLTVGNARDLIRGYDVVADGSDNFDTRYAVSDACFFERKPLVTAALGQFDGSLTTIRAHETGPDGRPNPTYRCLFPSPPPPGAIPTCAEAGVLGALAGVMGSLMAMEVIREIVGFGESLVGRLLMVDALRCGSTRCGTNGTREFVERFRTINPLPPRERVTCKAGRERGCDQSSNAPSPGSLVRHPPAKGEGLRAFSPAAPRRSSSHTSPTILAETASISTSVSVFSVGCRVTAMATDFLSGSMPVPS